MFLVDDILGAYFEGLDTHITVHSSWTNSQMGDMYTQFRSHERKSGKNVPMNGATCIKGDEYVSVLYPV